MDEEMLRRIVGEVVAKTLQPISERIIRIENVVNETKEICEATRSGKDFLVAQVAGDEKRIEIVENKQLRKNIRLDSHRNRISAVEEELNLFHPSNVC
jgi:hypothetical protein